MNLLHLENVSFDLLSISDDTVRDICHFFFRMKMIKIIFLLGFVVLLSEGRFDPKKCPKRNGNFPRPGTLCKGYYECKNWIPEEKTCPEGNHFNPYRELCDWEELYPCLEKPKRKECPRDNGRFLKTGTDCKKYYDCCNGEPTEKQCEYGTLFDPEKQACEWQELYTCIERPKREECLTENGRFLKPGTNCKKYYECRNGEPTEKQCESDTLFDPSNQRCEWPDLYTCVEKPQRKECPELNGRFLKPGTNCKKYYECRNGEPTEKQCERDTLFDPSNQRCEWPDLYTCIEKPQRKECPEENGRFLKEGTNCKKYYECRNGEPTEKQCERDTLFDPSNQRCEWPDLYTCIEKPQRKECPEENGRFLKEGTNCKKYYECRNGEPTEKRCEQDTLFDPLNQRCEWPDLYTCIEKPERKECSRRNGNFLKPNTNCRKYYECKNGEPELRQCERNALFNPETEECELMEYYTCVEKPERKECPRRNGNFLKPNTNCRKYYECKNGEPEERQCQRNALFNPETEECELMEYYTCVEKPERKECPRRNGNFLKPNTNCKKYYECKNGEPEVKKCPKNKLFNPLTENCESTEYYSCIENLSTTEKVPSTLTTIFTTTPRNDDDKEKTSTTTSRLTSIIFTTTPRNDDDKEKISTTTSRLTSIIFTTTPRNDDHKEKTSTTTSHPTSTIQQSTTSNPTTNLTVDPDFERTNSKDIETSTEIGTESTPTVTQTTITTTIKTTATTFPSSTQSSSTPSTANTISKEGKENDITEPPTSNRISTEAIRYSTSELITDSTTTVVVSTIKTKIPEEVTTSSSLEIMTDEPNIWCPEPFGHFPHPTSKHKFVVCVNNIPSVMDCPSNLIYRPDLKRCDYK
ncbi:hypothetical protein CDAR_405733 [Caerostris darwini]|uniref:Chitin-binding type-2 domain-containing protein n=1 Tax=Caerostris darwini TaxID=1538125 RepID=A0AAV4X3N4_9ARAC|nr:hypothetical protein CDAR_405733 [Caerostris darwini]